MKKFFAILGDSLRETRDSKLFYVMVGLSALTILFAGSVTFTPLTMEQLLEATTDGPNMAGNFSPELKQIGFRVSIQNFERLDDQREPWLGDYRFDEVVSFTLPAADDVGEARAKRAKEVKDQMTDAFSAATVKRQASALFRDVEVQEVKPTKDLPPGTEEIRYRITGKGTKVKSRQEWAHQPALFFGAVPMPLFRGMPMSAIITFIAKWVIGAFGAAFTMLISIVITASFLPHMLNKGTVDLLLAKPMGRVTLFLYKFVGGLLFMFLNTAFIMSGLWLVIGLQTGVWLYSLFLLILVYTALFAILYSVSAVVAVLTRSPIVCILAATLFWMLLLAIGWGHWFFIEGQKEGAKYGTSASAEKRRHWAFIGSDVLYTLTPRYKELDWLGDKELHRELLALNQDPAPSRDDERAYAAWEKNQERKKEIYDKQIEALDKEYGGYRWSSSLPVTGAFIALMLGFACWRFSVKDY